MKYLVDTHILLWLGVSPEKISPDIMRILEDPENEIYVSTISLWEIAIKQSIGKLDLCGIDLPDIIQMCTEQDITIVQFPVSAALQYRTLPLKEKHRDPFDRALISLCLSDSYTFLSADAKIAQYALDGLRFVQ